MVDELCWLDATAQAELVRRGEVKPLELVDAAIARIERLNPAFNAFIVPLFEKARRQAQGTIPDGPFRGVPFALKDLDVFSAGDPYHAGTSFLKAAGYVADHDSFLVEKFRRAGFINLGKTNTPEFGLNVTTEPRSYGPSRNPWNPEHSTGGSSGGSAAAVAAGMVPAAHASDGGGSIRIPASECGLVGLKPSRGRISLGPEHGEYWSGLVISHVVTRSVRDTAAILDAVAGGMPGDPYVAAPPARPYVSEVGRTPGALRIGLLDHVPSGATALHPDCADAVARTGKLLAELGHAVERSYPSALAEAEVISTHFMVIVATWLTAALDFWGAKLGRPVTPTGVEPPTWAIAEMGRAVSGPQYLGALEALHAYTRRMANWWAGGFDVLVTATLGEPPPRIGALSAPPEDPLGGMAKTLGLIPFTPPFNITGQPAISLPLHWNDAGLPVGIQLVADYGREDVLIRLAAQLEEARPWRDRRPPLPI
jgi:amidase